MGFLQAVWFRVAWVLASAWQLLLTAGRWVRDVANWKAIGLSVLVYIAFQAVVWGGLSLVGVVLPYFLRLPINLVVLFLLIRYFDQKYPQAPRAS